MRKILGIFGLMVLMMATSVLAAAPTGFHLDNQIDVTGDWKWDGSVWDNSAVWQTAQFTMAIDSNLATQASFVEVGTYGTPWHLDYESDAFVNAPVVFENTLNAWTVNPPDTTPGIAWTEVNFVEITGSTFSQSAMSVNGFGNVFIKSTFNLDNAGGQTIDLNIN